MNIRNEGDYNYQVINIPQDTLSTSFELLQPLNHHLRGKEYNISSLTRNFGLNELVLPEHTETPLITDGIEISVLRLASNTAEPTYKVKMHPACEALSTAINDLPIDIRGKAQEVILEYFPTLIVYDGWWKILEAGNRPPIRIFQDQVIRTSITTLGKVEPLEKVENGRVSYQQALEIGTAIRKGIISTYYAIIGLKFFETGLHQDAIEMLSQEFQETCIGIMEGKLDYRQIFQYAKINLSIHEMNPYYCQYY